VNDVSQHLISGVYHKEKNYHKEIILPPSRYKIQKICVRLLKGIFSNVRFKHYLKKTIK